MTFDKIEIALRVVQETCASIHCEFCPFDTGKHCALLNHPETWDLDELFKKQDEADDNT